MTRPRLFPDRPKGARALERNAAMVAMYQAGHIAREIGEAHNLSERRVVQILEANGITRRPRNTASVNGRLPIKKPRRHQGFQNRTANSDPIPAEARTLYACPGCGHRAANPMGHAQCQKQEAA